MVARTAVLPSSGGGEPAWLPPPSPLQSPAGGAALLAAEAVDAAPLVPLLGTPNVTGLAMRDTVLGTVPLPPLDVAAETSAGSRNTPFATSTGSHIDSPNASHTEPAPPARLCSPLPLLSLPAAPSDANGSPFFSPISTVRICAMRMLARRRRSDAVDVRCEVGS